MLNIYFQGVSAKAHSDGWPRVVEHLHLPLFRHAAASRSVSYSKYITKISIESKKNRVD
jgi:hypothetical protein